MKFSALITAALAPMVAMSWKLESDQGTYEGSGLNDCTEVSPILPPDYPLHLWVEEGLTMILFNDPNCQGPSTPAAGSATDLPLQSRYRVASFKVANTVGYP